MPNRPFIISLILGLLLPVVCFSSEPTPLPSIKVGVATVLTGDLSVLGQNIRRTVETYKKGRLRHPIEFFYEDAKKGGMDGLSAYQTLISVRKVDMLIGGTTSNGTLAAKGLINETKTVLITPLTGGSNIDQAGPYIFRIGNSDILNGLEQADCLLEKGLKRVALFTEETEYTQDIAEFFRQRFRSRGGELILDEAFLPDSTDFRTQIAKLKAKSPQALFMSTQTGLAFGLFVKQLRQLGADRGLEIHTNFLAAQNPDAFEAAGNAILGVYYLAPSYDQDSHELAEFFKDYEADHGTAPQIPFHTAGTVDALNMLQDYLDSHPIYEREGFREYLLKNVQNYKGLMGTYSFDSEGNSSLGFRLSQIEKDIR